MKSVFATAWHRLLNEVNHSRGIAWLYRWLRLAVQFLEEKSPEISQRGGFAHDIGWIEDLGWDPEGK